jgi:hypothetical protein
VTGTRELRQVIEEVFDLVAARHPEIDIDEARARFLEPYPCWDERPTQA